MRKDTIDKINARLELAQKRHGEFEHKAQVLDAIQLEIAEARYAFDWQDSDRFVAELLDVATVAIRGVEQLSSAEAVADAAKQETVAMPDHLWVPRVEGAMVSGLRMRDTAFDTFHVSMSQTDTKNIGFYYTIEQARAIRDWLNQFIAASEAKQ